MRAIEFQDSLYRQQTSEKIQSRAVNAPADDAQLAALKKIQEDAVKQEQIQETPESRDKTVNKDREEREKEEAKKRRKKRVAEPGSTAKPRPPSGDHLIDLQA